MSANITREAKVPEPLATDAATAVAAMGPCTLCRRAVLKGQRYGYVYPSGQLAHVVCVAQRATARKEAA